MLEVLVLEYLIQGLLSHGALQTKVLHCVPSYLAQLVEVSP